MTDATLGARLKDVRKAVGDNGVKQEIIKTFHGRGYRFIANARELENIESQDENGEVNSNTGIDPTEKPSIAVLQFA